jgi:hypothetical protein
MENLHPVIDSGILATASGAAAVPVYTFTLDSFKITETRSLHDDTDYVSFAVVVGLNPPITVPTMSMGNVDNGTHAVNLSIPNVPVAAGDAVSFTYSIVNTGYSSDIVEEALNKAIAAAASKGGSAAATAGGGLVGGPLGSLIALVGQEAFGWLAGKLEGVIFADCDGVVAGADHAYTGAQLAAQTADGNIILVTDNNKGTNSPDGCGANSQYYVTWSISTQPPNTGHGGAGGGGGSNRPPGGPPHRLD